MQDQQASTWSGNATAGHTTRRRVYRSRTDRVATGLLAGIAGYLGISARMARIVYTVVTIVTGVWTGVIVYVLASVLLAEEPFGEPAVAPPIPAQPVSGSPAPTVPAATQS